MGVFDSVIVKCRCGGELEFQSKAGPCGLEVFDPDEVPIDIAIDLDGEGIVCSNCDTLVRLRYPEADTFVQMDVEYSDYEYE